jgi:Uma2 family endonuclease
MAIPAPATFSSEEYIHLELFSQQKHEFFEGHIVAMAGASYAHIQIQSNLLQLIGGHFRKSKKSCEILASDLRVKAHDLKYFYPDLTVLCDKPRYDEKSQSLVNPTGIIEILSESTRKFDTDEKLFAYRAVPSLTGVALVDSTKRYAMIYERKNETTWEMREMRDAAAQPTVVFFGCELEINDIYRNSGV